MEVSSARSGAAVFSIVIPVHNERSNVAPLVSEIRQAMQATQPFEIIYVDDGSTDGTGEVLQQLKEAGHIRVVTHGRNLGQSIALTSGVAAAAGTWIASLDGDGQNDPLDLPRLFGEAQEACARDEDIVCVAGIRVHRNDSWLKRLSSRIANSVRRLALKDGIADSGCGLKVFRRDAFMAVPHFNHIHRFLPAVFQAHGGKVLSSPVAHRARVYGVSKYGVGNRLFVGIVDLFGVSWLSKRSIDRPWKRLPQLS